MRGGARYEASADMRREDALIVIELAEKMIKILEERIESEYDLRAHDLTNPLRKRVRESRCCFLSGAPHH